MAGKRSLSLFFMMALASLLLLGRNGSALAADAVSDTTFTTGLVSSVEAASRASIQPEGEIVALVGPAKGEASMPAAGEGGTPDKDATINDVVDTISAGNVHTCAIKADKKPACWGRNDYNQSSPPLGLFYPPYPYQLSAGGEHNCTVRGDLSVVCWGYDAYGETTPPAGVPFRQVGAGDYYTCGLKNDSTLTCWGKNDYGQSSPPGGTFHSIGAGKSHVCGIETNNDTLICWGSGYRDGYNPRYTPPGGAFTQVSSGDDFSCGIRTDGTLTCWGDNWAGQAPLSVAGTFTWVEAGYAHACAVRTDGTLACWGNNWYGQSSPPGGLPAGTFTQVSSGTWHSCGLRADGKLACWGGNANGQAPRLSLGPDTLPSGEVGAAYSQSIIASGGAAPYVYSIAWGSLPPGLSLNASTGLLSGTPTAAGAYTFVIQASDSFPIPLVPVEKTYTVIIRIPEKLSAGSSHTCGIKADGSVACWGDNTYGQSTPPGGTFSQVSAGGEHSCGVKADSSVACWGNSADGRTTPPAGVLFAQVSAGGAHTCGVKTDNTLACWGANGSGQAAPPGGTFIQVDAGGAYTCGVRTDGTLACWGANGSGQVSPPGGLPVGVFQQVSAGDVHACGMKSDGALVCWGNSADGRITPPTDAFKLVSAGGAHTCGVKTDGALACWGLNTSAQVSPLPAGTFSQVAAGGAHSCGLRTDGKLACWGGNANGQAPRLSLSPDTLLAGTVGAAYSQSFSANGGTAPYAYSRVSGSLPPGLSLNTSSGLLSGTPTASGFYTFIIQASDSSPIPLVPVQKTYVLIINLPEKLSAGNGYTCGVKADGALACWGWNDNGQAAPPGDTFAQVSAGGSHTCGLWPDGTPSCWGNNDFGQAAPLGVAFIQVSSGALHTCGVKTDSTLACWGRNDDGQTASPGGTFAQVGSGSVHTCGVKADGTLACWGNNEYGQSTPPGGTFFQVGVGDYHACGIKVDGTLVCWGWNYYGQSTPPTDAFKQVSGGGLHTCGVKMDGTLACWGNNDMGQATPPAGTFSQVSAGREHTCGLKTDGTVACWGNNMYGEAPRLSLAPAVLPAGELGVAYNQTLSASGGAAPYAYTVASGSLPPGLSLNTSSGLLSGTPSVGGIYTFIIRASDSFPIPLSPVQNTYAVIINMPEKLSAGAAFTCGMKTDGALACWGDHTYGQSTPPGGTFSQVSAGKVHACGLKTDGALACWGDNGSGQSTPPAGAFAQVSAGGSHTCGVRPDGTPVCWGDNADNRATPPVGVSFSQVSAGDAHTCGVKADGTLACWGYNPDCRASPPAGTFRQVSAGDAHTCGLKTNGTLACWGNNAWGQAPPLPAGTFVSVSVGGYHTCGVKTDGALACWGRNDDGQATPPAGTFRQISAGSYHTCGLNMDGVLACWGRNTAGQAPRLSLSPASLPAGAVDVAYSQVISASGGIAPYKYIASGNLPSWLSLEAGSGLLSGMPLSSGVYTFTIQASDSFPIPLSPVQQIYLLIIRLPEEVSAGVKHTCALREDQTASCRGNNDYGQSSPPAGTFTQISAGDYHTCGVKSDGSLACWGAGSSISGWPHYGQSIPPTGIFVQVSAGQYHTCGVRMDGSVVCWGDSAFGRTTPPAGQSFIQVSAGASHTCGIKSDRSLSCWGLNDFGQSAPPAGSFLQVSAGKNHTCGIRQEDRSLVCWGDSTFGQLAFPGGAYRRVSAGDFHACALGNADGAVACWGFNDYGQATPPEGAFEQIGAGYLHTCALGPGRTLTCWGDNSYGQATPIAIGPDSLPMGLSGAFYSQQLSASGGITVTPPYVFSIEPGGGVQPGGGVLPGGVSLSSAGLLSGMPSSNGLYTFTARVKDASSPSLSNIKTYGLLIDTPPTSSDGSLTILEDSLFYFGPASIAYHDLDGDLPGGIRITGLESAGDLECAGLDVNLNTICPAVEQLTFRPLQHANGSSYATFQFKVIDALGGESLASYTMLIDVTPVNDAPSFTKGPDQMVAEDSGAQVVAAWATNIQPGPANEAGQTVSFNITANTAPGIFSAQPSVSPGGLLSFTPAANASGSAAITLYVRDSGDTANGGVNVSPSETFTITITPVNDRPVLVDDSAITEMNTLGIIYVLDNDIDIDGSLVTVTVQTQPVHGVASLSPTGGALAYLPASGWSGVDAFTYQACDNGTPLPSQCATAAVTVTVAAGASTGPITSLAWGDLNSDGLLDLAVGRDGQPLRIYLNANGSLQAAPAWQSALSEHTSGLAWGDVDGDGDLDLAVGNHEQPIRIYRNLSAPGLPFADRWAVSESISNTHWVTSLAWGDVDGDGDLDLAVGSYDQPAQVYLNVGGVFSEASKLAWNPAAAKTTSLAWGDMNGDGHLDLAVGSYASPPLTANRVYLNTGSGLADAPAWTSNDYDWTNSVAWGDLDDDGRLELAAGNYGGFSKVYDNTPTGLSSSASWSTAASAPTNALLLGDWEGDGDLDLVLGSQARPLQVYLNQGTGELSSRLAAAPGWVSAESVPLHSLAWADMDNDGDLDLATNGQDAESPAAVYRNDGRGQFHEITGFLGGASLLTDAASPAWGDYDGDGDLDLALGSDMHGPRLYRNDGLAPLAISFTDVTTTALGLSSEGVAALAWGDYNNDNQLDLAAAIAGGGPRIYTNDGAGSFDVLPLNPSPTNITSLAWGDYDGDGYIDLAVGNYGQPNQLYHNDAGVQLTEISGALGNANDMTYSLAWGDMEGDGDLDLAVGISGVERLLRNDGGGQFHEQVDAFAAPFDDDTRSLAWGDYDNDGDLDLVTGNYGVNRLYRNDSSGHFILVFELGAAQDMTNSVVWGDLDGDGDLDIITGNYGQMNRLYYNRGNSVFQEAPNALGNQARNTRGLALGDVDQDGDLDLAVANYGSAIQLYRNPRQGRPGYLPDNSAWIDIGQPYNLPAADFYALSSYLTSRFVPITYTLYDAESNSVGRIAAFYSLDGGGSWLPAVPTNTQTTHLAASPTGFRHIFTWDTLASGLSGQSDNVVLRFVAYDWPAQADAPGSYLYDRQPAGPFQHAVASATTFPFRFNTTRIRVMYNGQPGPGAFIYLIPKGKSEGGEMVNGLGEPFRTDEDGYLKGRGVLWPGDRLVALMPITTTERYTLYYTSAAPTSVGLEAHEIKTTGVQTLTVSASHPLLLFNLDVSLEWDARNDGAFWDDLPDAFQSASEMLYDVSNGQAALGQVTLHVARQGWQEADVVIYAQSGVRPRASMGGVVDGLVDDMYYDGRTIRNAYIPGQIRIGPNWDPFGYNLEVLTVDWRRALAHELSHYLLFLPDNYLGIGPGSVPTRTDCRYSFMTNTYLGAYSEFLTSEDWTGDCLETIAEHTTGRTDWETVLRFYPALHAPANYADSTGPGILPLLVTHVGQSPNTLPAETIYVPRFFEPRSASSGSLQVVPRAQGFLFKNNATPADLTDDQVIGLGSTLSGGDRLLVRGAEAGDRVCVFGPPSVGGVSYLGCQVLQSELDASIPVSQVDGWRPNIIARSVTTSTLQFTVILPVTFSGSLNVQFFPAYGRPGDLIPVAPWAAMIPLAGSAGDTTITYTRMLTLSWPAFEGWVRIWDPTSPREALSQLFLSPPWGPNSRPTEAKTDIRAWGANSRQLGAPVASGDGQVTIFNLQDIFTDTGVVSLQAINSLPNLPIWLDLVGQGYRFVSDRDVERVISFEYIWREVPSGYENMLNIYYSPDEGLTWLRLPTTLDTVNIMASAAMPTISVDGKRPGEGIYALIATVEAPRLLEGWNQFSYSIQGTRPVERALASIEGKYTSVYYNDPDAPTGNVWQLHDATVVRDHPEFAALVNDLLYMEYQHPYWIYATEPVTPYLGISGDSGSSSPIASGPPTTYYGWVVPYGNFNPAPGMLVQAWINGQECGQGIITTTLTGGLAYKAQVLADSGDGCGTLGRRVVFTADGQPMPLNSVLWDNRQAWFHSQIDMLPPVVEISSAPPDPNASAVASFIFSGLDEPDGSGLASYECQLDSGGYTPCTSPLAFGQLADGQHTFEVRAVDWAGNASLPAAYTWLVDTLAPAIRLDGQPTNPTADPQAVFTFIASDAPGGSGVVGYECALEYGSYTPCTSPISYGPLDSGQHMFEVRAVDGAGNTSPPVMHTWLVDTLAPAVSLGGQPTNPTADPQAVFTFTASDNPGGSGLAGYECALDGGDYTPCASPQVYGPLADGPHTFQVRAVDQVGNAGSPVIYSWLIDTILPVVTITDAPRDPTNTLHYLIRFQAEAVAGQEASVDHYECAYTPPVAARPLTSTWGVCASPYLVLYQVDGRHTFQVRAVDSLGRTGPAAAYTWTWDRLAPLAPIVLYPALDGIVYPNDVGGFAFTGSAEAGSFVTVRAGGAILCTAYAAADGSWQCQPTSPLSRGEHTLSVTAADAAGNVSPATMRNFFLRYWQMLPQLWRNVEG